VGPGDRVATLAWNGHRHVEAYYAVPGMGSIIHTVNPRLSPDDIAYILDNAGSGVLLAESGFAALVAGIAPRLPQLRAVVVLSEDGVLPDLPLAPGQALLDYETLLAEADEDFAWPRLDEMCASTLCYTSGTTGQPKGVLYSHRSQVIHAYAINLPDVLGLRAVDRILPVVPMFHVNAWGIPHAAPLVGAALILPGRQLDGASLANLMNQERATFSAGVPTVWLGLLQHLRASGERLDTVKRLVCGGSACPAMLFEAFAEYGVEVQHAWGMTETSPLGTFASAKQGGRDAARQLRTQGRAVAGLDMRITDDEGREVPWDGEQFGNLEVRGSWVLRRYFGFEEDATTPDGWFPTGDVATIDSDGYMHITDRTKDVVKSGGEWISSIQLENIAVEHPDVAEAAVIGAKHPKWDERPLLLIVPKPGREVDPEAVMQLFEGRVAKWWLPDEVLIVEDLPHSATGKINKLALRQRFAGHRLRTAAE
ncbi:MAG: long-chain-fatty-acid--CoA ligase, partial [Acetobacteraceae bacterium]|nr:long-chain-fatty-acid--CoA ligase [Acetobacteraceae bacterium]